MNRILSAATRCSFALMSVAFAAGAHAAAQSPATDTAQARYKQERAACLEGRSHQDRETCLKEATNALAEARKNPETADKQELKQNALARCDRVRKEDRPACEQMAKGHGKVSGSVEGGGVVKEIVTTTIGQPVVIVPAQPATTTPR